MAYELALSGGVGGTPDRKPGVGFTEPLQIAEHLLSRTSYFTGLAITLSQAVARGALTEEEILQLIDVGATDLKRHLEALVDMLAARRPAPPPT